MSRKLSLAREMFILTDGRQIIDQIAELQGPQLFAAGLSLEMVDRFCKRFKERSEELLERITVIIASIYTEEELVGSIIFYQTFPNIKDKMIGLMTACSAVGERMGQEIYTEICTEDTEEVEVKVLH